MLSLEHLELREVPAGSITLVGTTLSVLGTDKADVIDIRSVAANIPSLQVTLNDQVQFFAQAAVTDLFISGGKGDDLISTFNTLTPAVIDAGSGDDTVQAGGANDVIFTGKGADNVYDILGSNVLYSQDDGKQDLLFSNAASQVVADANDQVVTFFAANRTPGAGSVVLENGVLYITPNNLGGGSVLSEFKNQYLLVTNWGGVTNAQLFDKKDVQFVAYFGGSGDDSYVNNTKLSEVGYGGLGGNDTLQGGKGKYTLLKGGGGNDVISGQAKVNDLAGNGGNDVLVSLAGKSKLRVDALDVVFSRVGDQLLLA